MTANEKVLATNVQQLRELAEAQAYKSDAEALRALAERDRTCFVMGPGLTGMGWICTVSAVSGHGETLAAAIMDALGKAQ